MNIENKFDQPKPEIEANINNYSKEALEDLKVTLEAQKFSEEEKKEYITKFLIKIQGETNEDLIDTALGNVIQESTLKVKERRDAQELSEAKSEKSTAEEEKPIARFCGQCGKPILPENAYCGACGNKIK